MAEQPRPIRVLLAEDHQVVREGLRALLQKEPDLEVVGEAADGPEALRLVSEVHPDLVVLDLGLPGLDGIEVARHLGQSHPRLPLLVLSMYDDAQSVGLALRAGVRGYVLKGVGVADLCEAIRRVDRGELYLSHRISELVLEDRHAAPETPLTAREREILKLVAEGYTARQIAERLGLSPKTVENHRANIMDKLGIHTIAGLVRYALRARIAQ
jgi:DNA-binding NarL/FixJ family response regulator